jgi:SAM-dependent methyltransferase
LIEVDNELIEAYNKISPKYTKLKTKPWRDFEQYLLSIGERYQLPQSGILLDVGSGNCRNLRLFENQEWEYIASDLSFELLNNAISLKKNRLHLINNDMKFLSIRENSIDFATCIATLHHLRDNDDVMKVLKNIKAVLKENEFLIISCWRRWKKGTINKMIKDLIFYPFKKVKDRLWRHGDIYLSWFGKDKEIVAKRYYHLFTKRELTKIVWKSGFEVLNFTKLGGAQGNDNFFLLLWNGKRE